MEKSKLPSKALFSKSDDELSTDSYNNSLESDNILQIKRLSNSTGSLDTPTLGSYKSKDSVQLMSFVDISEERNDEAFDSPGNLEERDNSERLENVSVASSANIFVTSGSNILLTSGSNVYATPKDTSSTLNRGSDESLEARQGLVDENFEKIKDENSLVKNRLSRHNSEPPDMYSSRNLSEFSSQSETDLVRQNSDSVFVVSRRPNIEVVFTPKKIEDESIETRETRSSHKDDSSSERSNDQSATIFQATPIVKNKFWNVYAAHTSTPSDLLRRNLANSEYILTPITSSDKSMSPITQSTTKMSKAMQVCMLPMLIFCFFDACTRMNV